MITKQIQIKVAADSSLKQMQEAIDKALNELKQKNLCPSDRFFTIIPLNEEELLIYCAIREIEENENINYSSMVIFSARINYYDKENE